MVVLAGNLVTKFAVVLEAALRGLDGNELAQLGQLAFAALQAHRRRHACQVSNGVGAGHDGDEHAQLGQLAFDALWAVGCGLPK